MENKSGKTRLRKDLRSHLIYIILYILFFDISENG